MTFEFGINSILTFEKLQKYPNLHTLFSNLSHCCLEVDEICQLRDVSMSHKPWLAKLYVPSKNHVIMPLPPTKDLTNMNILR